MPRLTTADLNRFYRAKPKDFSASHVRYLHATLRKALHEAEGTDLVRKNVAL